MKSHFVAALLVCSAFASAASCGSENSAFGSKAHREDRLTITSGDVVHTFNVEFAKTDEERRIGLMYREELADDAGKLFDFGPIPQPVSMWMKNTLIPLDMAFIDEHGEIVRIAAMTTPQSLESIKSGKPVIGVLEVRGGRLEELGVTRGDMVSHPLFDHS